MDIRKKNTRKRWSKAENKLILSHPHPVQTENTTPAKNKQLITKVIID